MNIGMNEYIAIWIFIIGLCLGSFYNVVICRFLSGESIVFPSSKCPRCQHKLYFWQNIPVLSYMLLGGKCYFCKQKISIQYPLVELFTAIFFLLSYLKFGLTFEMLLTIIICSCLTIMSVTDIREKLVDCKIAIIMAIAGLIYNFIISVNNGISSILGLIVACIILELIARVGYLVVRKRAMGEADTYVAGAIGACFGIKSLPVILLFTLVAAMVFVLPTFFIQQIKNKNIKVVILFTLFFLSVMLYRLIINNYFVLILLLIISVLLIIEILKITKIKNEQTYLPFVPALAIGAFVFLFI